MNRHYVWIAAICGMRVVLGGISLAEAVDRVSEANPLPPAPGKEVSEVISASQAITSPSVNFSPSPATAPVVTIPGAGPGPGVGPFWAPGGYEARQGSPYLYHDPRGGQYVITGNPYVDHWGPGFHRHSLHGHYRFPYYTYRAPWYYPGRAVYNRDTNFAW